MDKAPDDKTMPSGADAVAAASPPATPAQQPDANNEKSWGDKYKHWVLRKGRNFGINFVVNFIISALGTYIVLESPLNKILQKGVDGVAKGAVALGAPKKLGGFLGEFMVRTQLLLCGGHVLLPPLKSIHDHQKHLEFEIGHKLDILQQSLGRGDAASKRNISEYKYINDLLKAKPKELSEADKAMLARQSIGDDFRFKENPESWKHVLKARGLGVTFTTTLSALFALGSHFGEEKKMPWMDVKHTYLKKYGEKYGEKWLGRLEKVGIKKPGLLGELIVLELIYTAASKLGFDHMERRQLRKEQEKERMEAETALARDKEFLKQAGIRPDDAADIGSIRADAVQQPSAPESRRKIIEEGGKDFRMREASKISDPSPSMAI